MMRTTRLSTVSLCLVLGQSSAFQGPFLRVSARPVELEPKAWPKVPTSWPSPLKRVIVPSFPAIAFPSLKPEEAVVAKPRTRPSEEHPAWATATAFSLVFRSVGYVGFAVVLLAPAVLLSPAASGILASTPAWVKVVLGYFLGEGVFYAACIATATAMSRDPSFATPPLTSERRQELWTKILRDPTQSAQQFCEGWFYIDAGPRRVIRGGARTALIGYVQDALGFGRVPASGRVQYSELRRADVLHWLAAGLFEKPLESMSVDERMELSELVTQLEEAAGEPLRDPENQEERTPGIASKSSGVEPVRWLHRPLAYYGLTQLLWGQLLAPKLLGDAGFTRCHAGGLTYFVSDPSPPAARDEATAVRAVEGADATVGEDGEEGEVDVSPPSTMLTEQAKKAVGSALAAAAASASAAVTPRKPRKRAILFIHGVGVGPGPYTGLLKRLAAPTSDAELDLLFCDSMKAPPEEDPSPPYAVAAVAAAKALNNSAVASAMRSTVGPAVASASSAVSSAVGSVRMNAASLTENLPLAGARAEAAKDHADEEDEDDEAHDASDRLVIAVEVSQACQRIDPRMPAKPAEFAQQIEAVLDAHGIDDAIVVGHSLGTAYANYLRRFAPDRVAGLALIDPIAAMIHHRDTSEAFVYKAVGPSCKTAAEEYYIRRELWTANVVSRHMRWHEAALWPSDCMPSKPTLIVLSLDDEIVPVQAIRECATTWRARARGVSVLPLPGLGHGGWLGDAKAGKLIADRVRALHASRGLPPLDRFAP